MTPDGALPTACPNCGAALSIDPPPRHCPLCGQATRLQPPRFGEFVREFVGQYVALEGALWRTMGALLLRPGKLTDEYLAGRRQRYVSPLRVYLSASFLFFLVVTVGAVGNASNPRIQVAAGPTSGDATEAGPATDPGLQTWIRRCETPGGCDWLETRLAGAMGVVTGPGGARAVGERMTSAAPYAMFLMVPVFAGLLQAAWRRSGLNYGAHFVLALHLHAFAFLALVVAEWLPRGVDNLVLPLIAVHAVLAMRRVYAQRWPATIGRAALVGTGYGVLLVVATVLLVVIAVLQSNPATS